MKREERVRKECDSGEVVDVCHWLLQCSAWDHLRQQNSPGIITCINWFRD